MKTKVAVLNHVIVLKNALFQKKFINRIMKFKRSSKSICGYAASLKVQLFYSAKLTINM